MQRAATACSGGALTSWLDGRGWSARVAAMHTRAVLRDGTPVRLRAIRPDDKERLRIAFGRLSPRSVYQRFFHPVTALTADVLRELTELDFRDHVGLVLSLEDDAGERLVAVARFVREAPGGERAEFAITVADDYRNRGAATLLLHELVAIARAGGVRSLVANVLAENAEMQDVIRRSDLPSQRSMDDGIVRIVLTLNRT